jgi:hypothetical protein
MPDTDEHRPQSGGQPGLSSVPGRSASDGGEVRPQTGGRQVGVTGRVTGPTPVRFLDDGRRMAANFVHKLVVAPTPVRFVDDRCRRAMNIVPKLVVGGVAEVPSRDRR